MKQILFVTASDITGTSGNNVSTKEMIAAFGRDEGLEVSVACPAPLGELPAKIDDAVSEFHFVAPRPDLSIKNHIRTQVSMCYRLLPVLAREQFDLLVIRHTSTMIVPTVMAKVFGQSYVLLARGLAFERMRFSTILDWIFRVNVRLATDVYCAYSEIVDRVAEIRPDSSSDPVLFPNAVDPTEFEPQHRERAREALPVEYGESEFVVGFVGSLKPYHMLEELIRAFAKLSEDDQLLVIGDGPQRESLEELVDDLGMSERITFTGFVDHGEIDQYIAACDVLYGVIDPDHPGNAIKCYEYLACERPIVTDRRLEFEFVDEIGAGLTVSDVSVENIATALREVRSLSDEERLEMGRRGREYVTENHTWNRLVELVVDQNL